MLFGYLEGIEMNLGDFEDLYTAKAIQSRLSEMDIVNEVVFFEETDSTNNQAKRGAGQQVSGALYIAETQTGGRGRRGRSWSSAKGTGIYMSLMFRPDIVPSSASMLTLVAAIAVARAITENCSNAKAHNICSIKWPNDIVVGGRKVCGILTEMSASPDKIDYVIIGLGINVNNTEFDDEIKDIASSLYLETGSFVKRSDIVVSFVKHFTKYYEIFKQTCDMTALSDEYNKILVNNGRQVKILGEDEDFVGKAVGINQKGALLVEREDGTITEVIAGEVSVRGLYGYV